MEQGEERVTGSRREKIRSVTLWGAAVNVLLLAVKVGVGLLIRSSALVADGFHSLSDLATDFVVLVGIRISSRPPDEAHPYGHRRFETLASQVIGLVLLVVGGGFIWKAVEAIYQGKVGFPGPLVLVVAGISVVAKEVLFQVTRKVSRETQSSSLYANAWHHRSDSLSSLAVLAGGAAGLLGWGHADHAATIVVGVMIIGVAGRILYEGLVEITEHSGDAESISKIRHVLAEEAGISDWHALRTRKVGGELFIDVHILVAPDLTVRESHRICTRVEEKIRQALVKPANILIHVDPHEET